MHVFFITLLVVVGIMVGWFAWLSVAKLYKGQS